jgi:hypothetical protein
LKWRLVAVKWEDVTSLVRFNLGEDFEAKRLYKMSVGFVVKETDDYVVIADDLDLNLDGDSCNNYGTLIPRGCIREWRVIRTFDWMPRAGPLVAAAAAQEGDPAEQTAGKRGQGAASPCTVAELVHAHPSLLASADEVAAQLGIDRAAAAAELKSLEREGVVSRIGAARLPIYVVRRG